MKLFKQRRSVSKQDDAGLVMLALGGNRDAYGEIVSRYQNLLCSLAYSSTGDLKHSEDIAQEAFVEGWSKLDTLHDPEKIKSWLCGILRFKISRHYRKTGKHEQRENTPLSEHSDDTGSMAMEDSAISEQQQALLWQVLNQMEPVYREPMILFYREEQSVQHVAEKLELSEDAVKQRISRGRKLLRDAMSVFVEDTLTQSKPGTAFTVAVMSIISSISPPAKAALLGASAAKTGSLIKLTGLLTLMASLSGVIGSWFSVRASLAQSRTDRERQLVKRSVSWFFIVVGMYVIALLGLKQACFIYPQHHVGLSILSQFVVAGLVLSLGVLVKKMFAAMRDLRASERLNNPQAFKAAAHQPNAKEREYKSKLTLLGVPLCHFQFGMPEHSDTAAFGWIAGGTYAKGLLFAWGGVAVAPISIGIISFGLVTIGAISFGLISTGTVAIGVIAFGASAVGYQAFASLSALGWKSAISGGISIANQAALGPVALAKHENTELAASLAGLGHFQAHVSWVLAAITVLVIVPAFLHARTAIKRMKSD